MGDIYGSWVYLFNAFAPKGRETEIKLPSSR